MQKAILALAIGASAFENSYLSQMSQRAVKANTATMDNARVAKDSASYLESLPQASTPKVAAPSYLESLPSLEAAVAAPSAVKPTPTPAELAAAAAPVKLASGADADFAAQCVAVHKSNFRGACSPTAESRPIDLRTGASTRRPCSSPPTSRSSPRT